jgi:signal transduction histidine kinase
LSAMQDAEFETRQDYLAAEGIVAWIARRLSDKRFKDWTTGKYSEAPGESGFVNLVIRLPGETEKRVACIVWPNPEKDKRPTILDWVPEKKRFSPLSTEVEPERATLWTWEQFLPLVHDVLSCHQSDDSKNEVKRTYRGNVREIISHPISVNGAAIGCLQIARSDPHLNRFSQMARRHIFQIANLLAPSVQSYRELAGLDLMSITFARKLAEKAPYSPEQSIESIIKLLHDVFAPTVTRLSVDFGFSSPRVYWETTNDVGNVKDAIEREVAGKQVEDYRETVSSTVFPRKYQLLKKRLTTRVGPSYGPRREKKDEFILGDLVFAVDAVKDAYIRPALGVNYLHRKTACTLAAAAYLDFSREYFGHILKTLGQELSAKRLNFEDWFNPIRTILTKDAELSWLVVRQRRQKTWFGDPQGLRALERMKEVKHKITARSIKESSEIRRQYEFSDPESNTNHVLKLRLAASEASIWVGIARPGFGPELDFPSPWKTFLVNFVQITDASLSRITLPEKFKEHVEAAQLQGIIASVATTGTMVHQLSNMIASQQHAIRALRDGFTFGEIKAIKANGKAYEKILSAMNNESTGVLQLVQSVRALTSTSDQRPCRLADAARHALKLYEVSLIARSITREINIDDDIWINVPFTVAALALANLVGNSKDAMMNKGRIHIDAREDGETVICRFEDTGPGIASETRDLLFEPKRVTKPYGTGMGLYLTRHSLAANDSSIELTESNDKGSVFTIRFPKAKERTN